jgi:hypothetical protein
MASTMSFRGWKRPGVVAPVPRLSQSRVIVPQPIRRAELPRTLVGDQVQLLTAVIDWKRQHSDVRVSFNSLIIFIALTRRHGMGDKDCPAIIAGEGVVL